MEVETDVSGEEVEYIYTETRHEHKWEDTLFVVLEISNIIFPRYTPLEQCAICGVLRVKVNNG